MDYHFTLRHGRVLFISISALLLIAQYPVFSVGPLSKTTNRLEALRLHTYVMVDAYIKCNMGIECWYCTLHVPLEISDQNQFVVQVSSTNELFVGCHTCLCNSYCTLYKPLFTSSCDGSEVWFSARNRKVPPQ
jgi:hypothetical protein